MTDKTGGQKGSAQNESSFPEDEKVSPSIKAAIATMMSQGISRECANGQGVSLFSGSVVKVDRQCNIQTYIRIKSFGLEEKSALETNGVLIEIYNQKMNFLQAWIPFDRVFDTARLPFVTEIAPPGYGFTK
jgi:hypothetical protein